MANELDKTIEELESEVLEELEEAEHGAMKLKPNATATDPMDKLDSDGATGATETIPGSTPDKVAPHGGAAASKGVKADTTIPKKGKADKMDKAHGKADGTPTPNKSQAMAAGYEPEGDEELSEARMTKEMMKK